MASTSNDHSVDIYLPIRGAQTSFLSIPKSDIRRLSTRPFKWMRFVMFSICGARGDLSATPDGPPVSYESTSLDGYRYYYIPSGQFSFVDPYGLNDRISCSPSAPPPSPSFRRAVEKRDGWCCVVTEEVNADCDAAHLIPWSKGSEYIQRVTQIRARCYDPMPDHISDIDAVGNGMLLSMTMHNRFARGADAFLKTPNFAMDASDIPRIERGSYADRITLHQFEPRRHDPDEVQRLLDQAASGASPDPMNAFCAGLHMDAMFLGTADDLPPAMILDFLYGVTAYKRWTSESFHDVVEDFFAEHYKSIPAPTHRQPGDFDGDEGNTAGESTGSACFPSPKARQKQAKRKRRHVLADAMDEMSLGMMYVCGITQQEAARMREEEEMKAREAGRTKVMEWRKAVG